MVTKKEFAEKARLEVLRCPYDIKGLHLLVLTNEGVGGKLIYDKNEVHPKNLSNDEKSAILLRVIGDFDIDFKALWEDIQRRKR